MRRHLLAICLFLTLAGSVAAKNSADLLYVSYGVATAFNLDTNKIGAGHLFGLGLVLTDSLEADFVHVMGDNANLRSYNLLRLNLYVKDKVGFGLAMGSENTSNLVTGLALFFDLFANKKLGIATVFQLRLEYLITRSVNTTGTAVVGITAKLGI